jgi:hypothetical protein
VTETQGLILAFGFGCGYNWLIVRWGKSEWGEGFTALWVVIGVFVTLLISAMVHVSLPRLYVNWLGNPLALTNQQHAAIFELKFFIATGIPMFLGSIWRYINTPE